MSSAAVFDLDGTVTFCDMYVAFVAYVLRKRPHRVLRCMALPALALRFKVGSVPNDVLKSRVLAAVAGGCERAAAEHYARDFIARHLDRMVKPGARARIEWHRREGHHLILASASLDLYAALVGTELGFASTVCTRTASVDGRITGALDGENLRGPAKLAAVRKAAEAVGAEIAYAYSDQRSDLPILLAAGQGIAIDPDARFAAEAVRNGLVVERWGGRWGTARTAIPVFLSSPSLRSAKP